MISVVIPAYNASRFIRQTIDSVLSQTYKDFELIVVDDGSTDNTGEIVKSYGEKVRYIYQNNAGDGPARNTGIKAAKSEWIAFLDHDDKWLPEKLKKQTEFINAHPELQWCATSFYQTKGSQQITIGMSPEIKELSRKGAFVYFEAIRIDGARLIMTSTVMVRKSVFENVGMYEAGWLRIADQDMWWRIAHKYPNIGFLAEPLTVFQLDLQSGLGSQLAMKDTIRMDARRLVQKHLILAKEAGDEELFKAFAVKFVKRILRTTLYNGYKQETRETLKLFPDMFRWHERTVAFILSTVPWLTSFLMRSISNMINYLHLNKELTRRHNRKEVMVAKESVK